MTCGACSCCSPHGPSWIREGYEYRDLEVGDDGSGRFGLALFRRPIPPKPEPWERVEREST